MADDVAEFIHENDLSKCVLIGHSMYVSIGSKLVVPSTDGMACHGFNNIIHSPFTKGAPKPP